MPARKSFALDLRREIEARTDDGATNRRVARELREVSLDEIVASTALAGSRLDRNAVRELLERGRTVAGTMRDHAIVIGYARAMHAATRRSQHAIGARLITPAEIWRLHAAMVGPSDMLVGTQTGRRRENLPPVREQMQTTAHWLIERELGALTERTRDLVHEEQPFARLAAIHERIERIRPFITGNGRIARIVVSALLQKTGWPPMTIAPTLGRAYRAAQRRADRGDLDALAVVIERGVRSNLERIAQVCREIGDLAPLRSLDGRGMSLAGLRKAAQRGGLRTVTLAGEAFSRAAWIDEYLAARSPSGRR